MTEVNLDELVRDLLDGPASSRLREAGAAAIDSLRARVVELERDKAEMSKLLQAYRATLSAAITAALAKAKGKT